MQKPKVSIRSYSTQTKSHQHNYHQLVMPLQGVISIAVGSFNGEVGPGDCVIVRAGSVHAFSALEQAKFLVVDSALLPNTLITANSEVLRLSGHVLTYIEFIEQQLLHAPNSALIDNIITLLFDLLSQQNFNLTKDSRIQQVISYIDANLAMELSLSTLARLACLSLTQFKKRFKEETGDTCNNYILNKRMNRAKAMLLYTDTPISIVAESVGYQNQSSFTRRFKQTFGLTPNNMTK